jgi:diguanylate cyclase (GGDEF)-like protein
MLPAPLPANETERLRALRSYDILDTAYETTFDEIVKLASRIVSMPVALVSLVDSDRQWFKARVGFDLTQTPRDHAFCAHTILGTDLMIVPDATRDARFADNPFVTRRHGVRFYAGAPLINPQGYALGTLCVIDTKARNLSDEERDTLTGLARTAGTTLELHRAMKQVRDMAMTDPLTGLGNRRAFVQGLERALAQQAQHQGTLELLCIDLDGFKGINDRFGHAAGDAALLQVAAVLRSVARRDDLAARIGGDEFALIQAHRGDDPQADTAERIRSAIEATMRQNGWPATASIGSARLAPGISVAEAMNLADSLMYSAKAAGKNRVHRTAPVRNAA